MVIIPYKKRYRIPACETAYHNSHKARLYGNAAIRSWVISSGTIYNTAVTRIKLPGNPIDKSVLPVVWQFNPSGRSMKKTDNFFS